MPPLGPDDDDDDDDDDDQPPRRPSKHTRNVSQSGHTLVTLFIYLTFINEIT